MSGHFVKKGKTFPAKWLLDPEAFGGLAGEARQMDFVADACRRSAPRADFQKAGIDKVRLPGERALKVRAEQLRDGVKLHDGIMPQLTPWAETLGVAPPASVCSLAGDSW